MKAVRLHAYHQRPQLDEVPEPTITGPHDVIVRVGGAGLCRTDLHIRDGWFAPAVPTELPVTLGHETSGWVHEVGSAVEHAAPTASSPPTTGRPTASGSSPAGPGPRR